jgi:D-glycero-D-manno-heptose 1,7-bisphosphate phosphatase
MTTRRRAVFLDRDGVLNRAIIRDGKPYPPSSTRDLVIDPDAGAALSRLKAQGFLLLVVTNQPDVRRGIQRRTEVDSIHDALRASLPLDDFFTCFHDDADGCACRKPKPGLMLQAAEEYDINLTSSFLIGDRWRDIDAAAAAGCSPVWIHRSYSERRPSAAAAAEVASLSEAVDWILEHAAKAGTINT